jgi:glycerol-3-phosphate cytidylyltransferase-like family protein
LAEIYLCDVCPSEDMHAEAQRLGTQGENPCLPVHPLAERALSVLSNRAVDDVLLAPPPRLTPDFLDAHGITTVRADY